MKREYPIHWIPIVLSIAIVVPGTAKPGQGKHGAAKAPAILLTLPFVERPDDAEARQKAELLKYGGKAPYEYLRFKQEAASKETRRWSWTFPGYVGKASIAAPLTSTLMAWTPLGPTVLHGAGPSRMDLNSGRPTAIVTHPTSPTTLYLALAGSGVWKCTNASLTTPGDWTWNNITDALPSSSAQGNISVGDLAMDPVNPETLYLGMGDPLSVPAIGFFVTHDGGATWTQGGALGNATTVRKILPLGANSLLVVTNEERSSIYRSSDAGSTFTRVTLPATFDAANYSAFAAAAFSPNNLVVTGMSYDPATGLVPAWIRSSDAGQTWVEISVPTTFTPTGATSPHTLFPFGPNIVAGTGGKGYALVIDGITGKLAKGLFITLDFGSTWAFQDSPTLWHLDDGSEDGGQATYNILLTVDPADSQKIFAAAQMASFRSLDGGLTWEQLTHLGGNQRVYAHADFHVATWSKTGTKTLYLGNDGGLAILRDPYRIPVPSSSAQAMVPSDPTFLDNTRNKGIQSQLLYTIASTTASTPSDAHDRVAFGMQDNGVGIRSDDGSSMADSSSYEYLGVGDGMGVLFHPLDGTKLIASGQSDSIDVTTNLSSSGFGTWAGGGFSGQPTWYTPIVAIRSDPTGNSVLSANNDTLFKSTNFGVTWTALPMIGTDPGRSIRRIAASPTNPQVFAFTTINTSVRGYYTADGGNTWSPFGGFPSNGGYPFVAPWGISIGTGDQTLYATATMYDQNVNHIWKSLNRGRTWTALDGSPTASNGFPFGLPVQFLRESLVDPSTLYAGTDFGLYVSQDSGVTWFRFGTGLPMVQVTDMYEAPDGSFLRVATYGRGAWEIRLIVPLPLINWFTSEASTLTDGQNTTLSWDVEGATHLLLDPGNLDVTSLTSTAISPTATTTYTLTGSNSTGSAIAQTTVTVVPAPTASLRAAQTTITSGTSTTLTPTFSGGTATITGLTGSFTSGTPVSTGNLSATTTFTLTVTNAARSTASSSVTITVADISLTISPTRTHMGTGVPLTFSATVTNAANQNVIWSVSGGSLSATTGHTVTFTAPTTPGAVTLTITSVQDTSRTVSMVIQATSLDLRTDGSIDVLDLAILAQAFTGAGNKDAPNYLSSADLDGDGSVDEDDLALFLLQM